MRPTAVKAWLFGTLFAVLPATWALAQASYPMLMHVDPVAVQIGQVSEHEVLARYNLNGAYQVLVEGVGVTGEVLTPFAETKTPMPDKGKAKGPVATIKVRFKVAADAIPGRRDFRIATPQGVSTMGQLVVVTSAVINEQKANDTAAEAQAVTLPATLCGTIEKAEDVDFFKFQAAAGQALTFVVWGMRLQDRIHDLQQHVDPIVTIRNAAGAVVAEADNFYAADPVLHHRFEHAGEYTLAIRDVRYLGNVSWKYAVEVSDRPFVTNVHPSRLVPGKETAVTLSGFGPLPAAGQARVTLPADAEDGRGFRALALPGGASNPAPVVVSRLPEVVEGDTPNNTPEQATPLPAPGGASGRIESENDVDVYAFEAKKGQNLSLQVIARRQGSALDSVLRIINDKGVTLVENDDLAQGRINSQDSLIENWSPPADGRYFAEVRDLHSRGGDKFTYFLEISKAEPHFTLATDTDKTLLAPGACAAVFLRAVRKNGFTGEIQLHVDGLPQGVTAHCGRILADGTDGCIVLQCAPDAPRSAVNLTFRGTANLVIEGQPPRALAATAEILQEIYMPGGGRSHYPVSMHTVSVGDVLDIKTVKLSTRQVRIKPGTTQKIEVTIERTAGFEQNVTLDVIYQHLGSVFGNSLPAGVTVDDKESKLLLTGKLVQGTIALKAAPTAKPVQNQQIVVMAHVSINFVMKFSYASEPVLLTVDPPDATAAK